MANVLILTTAYPFGSGEQYIEDEISAWCESGAKVVIAPMSKPEGLRDIPATVDVEPSMAMDIGWKSIRYYALTIFWVHFWKEIKVLIAGKNTNIYCYAKAIENAANILRMRAAIRYILGKYERFDLVYSYWNDVQSYAAVSLKKENKFKMVSRAHGFDIYKSRRKYGYMPYKLQFIDAYDDIYAVSEQGKHYLSGEYLPRKANIDVARLGVAVPSAVARVSELGCLNIVSVSACVPVKRIDKIVLALEKVCQKNTEIKVSWVHIGGGPQLNELINLAKHKLSGKVDFLFLGGLRNEDVHAYYLREKVDVFLNSSESEGVPFSIMEAMSYGVPAIAPDVGGVSELVNSECGYLMKSNPSTDDIAEAIVGFAARVKDEDFRNKAREVILSKYSARANYASFVKEVLDE